MAYHPRNPNGSATTANSAPVTIASDQAAISVSVSSAELPTGAATETTLGTRLSEATFAARVPAVGQKTAAASVPVILASDQALPLPSGASTEATLETRLAESTFTSRVPTVGQKTSAASVPVVLPSDQTVAVSASALPLPSGAATQTTLATLLSETAFTTRIPTLGQKAMAGSVPVVLSSDHGALTVTGSTVPANSFGTDTLNALNEAVTVAVLPGHSSWTVQATGTFVATFQTQVSLDGTNWTPVNSRQSGTGALKNSFFAPGIFRGSCGGTLFFRVVCTSYTNGTPVISVLTGAGVGAIFSNSIVLTQEQFQYYASTAGGSQGYNATTEVQNISAAGGPVAYFRNPSGSAVDVYIESISRGSNTAGRIERFRNPAVSAVTTAVTSINRGGAGNTASGQLFVPANFTLTDNGTPSNLSYIGANANEVTTENGSIILRPGQSLLFRYDPDGGGTAKASVGVVWWEAGVLT